MKKLLFVSFMGLFSLGYSQELSNAKYQKILLMDGEKKGWLDITVDPSKFECDCESQITISLKPTSQKNIYKSEDGIVILEIKNGKYTVKLTEESDCCFIRAGVYSK